MNKYKPFNFDPIVNAANALTQFEKSYRENAIAQANEPVRNPFHNHNAPPIQILNTNVENESANVDREIENAQSEFNGENKSIYQWHQSCREQVMREIEKIDRQHNEMVEEYTAKFSNRLSKLCVTREALRHKNYNDDFEYERFTIDGLIDIHSKSNRIELNPVRFPRPSNLEYLEEGEIREYGIPKIYDQKE